MASMISTIIIWNFSIILSILALMLKVRDNMIWRTIEQWNGMGSVETGTRQG